MAVLILTVGSIGGGIIRTTFFPVIERDNINITLQLQEQAGQAEEQQQRDDEKASSETGEGSADADREAEQLIGEAHDARRQQIDADAQ